MGLFRNCVLIECISLPLYDMQIFILFFSVGCFDFMHDAFKDYRFLFYETKVSPSAAGQCDLDKTEILLSFIKSFEH